MTGRCGTACVFDECLDRMVEIVGAHIRCVWRGTVCVSVCVTAKGRRLQHSASLDFPSWPDGAALHQTET